MLLRGSHETALESEGKDRGRMPSSVIVKANRHKYMLRVYIDNYRSHISFHPHSDRPTLRGSRHLPSIIRRYAAARPYISEADFRCE